MTCTRGSEFHPPETVQPTSYLVTWVELPHGPSRNRRRFKAAGAAIDFARRLEALTEGPIVCDVRVHARPVGGGWTLIYPAPQRGGDA